MYNFWAIDERAAKQLSELIRAADLAALAGSPLEIADPETTVQNGVAVIPIKGILTKEATGGFIRFLMGGGTSYQGIIDQVAAAEDNPEVQSIEYHIDSPGGVTNGFFDAAKAIKESQKPSVSVVTGMAASAAYGLATQADKIVARNAADMIGSIGIVQSFFVSENVVDVTSSNAPHKAPDPKTDSGFKAIQEQLDMIEGHFIKAIAEGRNTKPEVVKSDYGRGMVMTADVALSKGMIDSIANDAPETGNATIKAEAIKVVKKGVTGNASKKTKTGGEKMGLRELLNDNPDAAEEHAKALADAEGAGVSKERTRVKAHIAQIEHSKDAVVKAITEGDDFDAATMSEYMLAATKTSQGSARTKDNPGAVKTGDGADDLGGDDKKQALAAAVESKVDGLADESKCGIFG